MELQRDLIRKFLNMHHIANKDRGNILRPHVLYKTILKSNQILVEMLIIITHQTIKHSQL